MKTLFHELGHNTDENSREGIKSRERLQTSTLDTNRYYEWANTIFERAVSGKNFYKNNNALQLSDAGYGPLSPLGSMLSCALGISEIEFARIKDRGKDYEEQFFEEMFPSVEGSDAPHGAEILKNVKNIFNLYELDINSFSQRRNRQDLLNAMYTECLGIMQKRIEIELQKGNIQDAESYKKHQMFFLKKMNFNFKSASKSDAFIFSRAPIVSDIGFCTDKISRKDFAEISAEQIAMVDFGFDNSTLEKYSTAMTSKTNKKTLRERLKFVPSQQSLESSKTNTQREENRNYKESLR